MPWEFIYIFNFKIAQGGVETQGLQLDEELGGYYGVKC
jgi:hypothetical protein